MPYSFAMSIAVRRFLPWLFTFWLLGITIRFYTTTIKTLDHPFNPGSDIEWFIGWMGFATFWTLAYVIFKDHPQIVTKTWMALYAGIAIAMIVLSRTGLPFLLAIWIFLICSAIGSAMLRFFLRSDRDSVEQIACGVPLGFLVLALAGFLFGIFQMLTPAAIWLLLAVTTLLFRSALARFLMALVRTIRLNLRPGSSDRLREGGLLLVIAATIGLVNLTWAVAPEIQYDALNYHLAVPKTYLAHGGILEIEFFHAYFVRLIEIFFSICLAIGGSETVKASVFVASMCTTVCVFALGRFLFGSRVGLWAAVFFLTTPLVGWLSGTAYIDNIIALFVTASFFTVAQWLEDRNNGRLYIAALLAGAAIGCKPNATFAYVVIAPLAVWHAIKNSSRGSIARTLGYASLLFVVTAAPTYILIYSFTGNPVFPLFNGIFGSPKWEPVNTIMNASDFGLGTSISSLARFPFRMIFDTNRFGEGLPRGSLGLSLLLALPFAVCLLRQQRKAVAWFVGCSAAYLLLVFYTMQYGRYYIPILPTVTILGIATAFHLSPKRHSYLVRTCLLFALIIQPAVSPVQFWNMPERFPLSVAFGFESREAFLTRALHGYAAVMHINTVAAPEEKVLGVDTENLRFHARPAIETASLSLRGNGLRLLLDKQPDAELAAELKRLGFVRLFTTRHAVMEFHATFPYLRREFLEAYAVREFADENALVYRFR